MRRPPTAVVPLLAAVCVTLAACSEDDGTVTAGSPVVVTQYTTGAATPTPRPVTAGDASGDGPVGTGQQEGTGAVGLDPAYITTWARHGGALTLNSDGTGTYTRSSGAMNVWEWMITWQGSGNSVQFVLGEQVSDLGDPSVRYSTGARLTGTISADGTAMTVPDSSENMALCRVDAYDPSCGP